MTKFLQDLLFKGAITADGDVTLTTAAGTGTRMVVADATGKLSVQAIPTFTEADTLATVTARGNTTTSGIGVGSLGVQNPLYTGGLYLEQTADNTSRISGGPQENIVFGSDNGIQINTNVLRLNAQIITHLGYLTNYYPGHSFSAINFIPAVGSQGLIFGGNFTNNGAGGIYGGSNVIGGCNIETTIGDITLNQFTVENTINTTGGLTTHRGFYYNPTLTSTVGLTNIAFESTSGIVKISDLSGTGTRMVVADAVGKLGVQTIPTVSLTDTLDSVTDRGATTTNAITTGGITANGVVSITTATGGLIEFYPEGGSNATYSWMRAKLGSGLAPTLAWYGDIGGSYKAYGIYGPDSTYDGLLIYREAPTLADVILMGATRIALPSTQVFVWSSSTNVVDTPDLGLAREAAGLLQINNSSLNTYASLKLLNLTATGLAGSGTRMVTVDSNGLLGAQAIPTGGTGSSTLSGLTDVNITTVADNQLLKYDSATSKWINWTPNYLTSYTEVYQGTVTSVALSTGTSGTDINVSGSPITGSGTITLNIPNASSTARGVVSTGAQTFVGQKTFHSLTTTFDSSDSGTFIEGKASGVLYGGIAFSLFVQFNAYAAATQGYVWKNGLGDNVMALEQSGVLTVANLAGTGTRMVVASSTGVLSTQSIPSGTGITDGDKGDITVSSSGSVWTIDNGVVGLSKLSATGTASATTFLRGDNTWATPTDTSVYTTNGTLSSNRTITGADKLFTITGLGSYTVETPNTSFYQGGVASNPYFLLRSFIDIVEGPEHAVTINHSFIDLAGANVSGFMDLRIRGLPTATTANILYINTTTGKITSGALPSNSTITLSGAVTGSGTTSISTTLANSIVGIANLSATGTPSASTYLRGDNTWATISTGGGYTVTSQTANYTATATTGTLIIKGDTTGGLFTVTLPTAVDNQATIIVKKTAGTANLKIDADGTETIDGSLTVELVKVNESLTLISDNANWQIV